MVRCVNINLNKYTMKTSTEIINKSKKRFKELQHKNFDWRSFYNGYLEGQAEQLRLGAVVGQSEQLKNAKQEGYAKGWQEGAEYGYNAAASGR